MPNPGHYAIPTRPAMAVLAILLLGSALVAAPLVLGSHRGDAPVGPPSAVSSFPGESRSFAQVTFAGGPAANEATLDIDGSNGEYLVSDRVGLTANSGCRSTSRTTARCTRFDADRLLVDLGPGNDSFKLLATRKGRMEGGRGSDRITGSAKSSRIYGDKGRDVLRGLGGEDSLIAGPDRDRLYGGPNDDSLRADSNDRDRTIACGPGRDKATIDRKLDPEPKNCERIKLR